MYYVVLYCIFEMYCRVVPYSAPQLTVKLNGYQCLDFKNENGCVLSWDGNFFYRPIPVIVYCYPPYCCGTNCAMSLLLNCVLHYAHIRTKLDYYASLRGDWFLPIPWSAWRTGEAIWRGVVCHRPYCRRNYDLLMLRSLLARSNRPHTINESELTTLLLFYRYYITAWPLTVGSVSLRWSCTAFPRLVRWREVMLIY